MVDGGEDAVLGLRLESGSLAVSIKRPFGDGARLEETLRPLLLGR